MSTADLAKVGIADPDFQFTTVAELVSEKVIERPIDGNHGEIHPKAEDFVTTGIPFLMASDINNGVVDYTSCKFISRNLADSLRKGFSRNGDVLLTHKATIGRTAIVAYHEQPYVMLTPQVTYYRVRDKRRLSNRYLRHYFESGFFQGLLNQWAGAGSTRAYLGITEQGKLPVVVPPIKKQEKIAAVLSAYDDLIENNRRRIVLLERMAEQLYREWFVRFRFPGYQGVAFEKGLPATGWEVKSSSELFDVMSGGTPNTDTASFWNGDIPFFTPKDAPESFYVLSTEKTLTPSGLEACNSRLYPRDTIFITARGTVGKLALADVDMAMNQSCYALAPKIAGPVCFHFLALKLAVSWIKGVSNSGVFDNIVVDTFKVVPILLPPNHLIRRFNDLTAPIFEQISGLLSANVVLAKTRDLLLPRLISGKLRVDDLDIQFPPSMQDAAA